MNGFIVNHIVLMDAMKADMRKRIMKKYGMSTIEVDVLLFLVMHPESNTAQDMVHALRISKSHVSLAVQKLEKRSYIAKQMDSKNHRKIHLMICDKASDVVQDCLRLKDEYMAILLTGFSEEEKIQLCSFFRRIVDNVMNYFE